MAEELSSKESIKRILTDLKNLDTKLLELNNIYYYHDEENIYKGYAMIVGPKDTLYYGGYYFFEFTFSHYYPFKPPVVKFKTCDGKTRFHPNLYRDGKVCLSILNTWRGETWSSCQSISTVLLQLVVLLDKEPFLHEPGITNQHKDYNSYHKIVFYKNIKHSIMYYLNKERIPEKFEMFYDIIIDKFKMNIDDILVELNKTITKNNIALYEHMLMTNVYKMTFRINYKMLLNDLEYMKKMLKDKN